MTFYSIKYLETRGIETFEGAEKEGYAAEDRNSTRFYPRLERIGRDAFTDRAAAVEAGRKILSKRIVSLKKRIAKIETLREKLA